MPTKLPQTVAEKWVALTSNHDRDDRNLNGSTYIPGVVIAPR